MGPLELSDDLHDAPAQRFAVALDGISDCQRCQRGQGCGAILSDTRTARTGVVIPCLARTCVSNGERVVVEIDDEGSAWLGLVLGAYGLPLLGMLLATGLAAGFAAVLTGGGTAGAESDVAYGVTSGVVNTMRNSTIIAQWQAELGILLAAVTGFIAGHFGWRQLSARAMCSAEHSLCLQSARIVGSVPCSKRDI